MSKEQKTAEGKAGLSANQQAVLDKLLKGKLKQEFKKEGIPKRNIQSPVNLSFAQQRLWILDRMVPGSAFYNIPTALTIQGKVDGEVFERSINELVRRHESLRTIFKIIDDEPKQVILPELKLKVNRIDLRSLDSEEQQAEVFRVLTASASQPFDLEKGPMLRVNLLQVEAEKYVLQLTTHHIISDTWSMEIFNKELVDINAAFSVGKPSPLPEPGLQYPDFALWQRDWLHGEVLEKQLNYWKEVLGGELPILELPVDRQRPAVPTYLGKKLDVNIPQELTRKLIELNREERCSMFMNLLACFYVILYRWTNQEDILVGSPIANRTRPELEEMIGFFANTLVFRTGLSGNPTFRELLGRVRKVTSSAYDNQDVPFEKLVEDLQPDRYMSHTPFFQVMFVLQNVPMQEIDPVSTGEEVSLGNVPIHTGSVKFDLWLSLIQDGDRLAGLIEYSTDIFMEATVAHFIEHLINLIEAVGKNPDLPIDDLIIMSETEKKRLLYEWNDTGRDYECRCLHHAFADQAQRIPDSAALIFEDSELTYKQLNEKADRLAAILLESGVTPGMPVGVCLERSLELVIALFGILKAGGAYLPLDPEYPDERLDFMMKDSGLHLLLSSTRLLEDLPGFAGKILCLDEPGPWKSSPAMKTLPGSEISDPAYIIYTSGSTGRPKGALIAHEGISNRLLWMQEAFCLTPGDRVLQKTPFSFDVSVWEFFWPLITGAVLVLARPGGHKESAYIVEAVVENRITTMHFVPSMLNVFLEDPELEKITTLKRVICSGEALPQEYVGKFYSHFKDVELHNLYGPTEASVDVTWWPCPRGAGLHTVPIGKPIANTQVYILDEKQQIVPTGVHGELHIGGVQLARGYLNRPELTTKKFVASGGPPFCKKVGPKTFHEGEENRSVPRMAPGLIPRPRGGPAGGKTLYKTGDLCRWLPDGNIEFLGRLDFQVKVRGFRIELGEIKSLLRSHEAVHDAEVVAKADKPGSQNKKLVGYVIPRAAGQTAGSEPEQEAVDISGEQVKDWQGVFDSAYARDHGQKDATFNIIGWDSSYTGQAIPAEEMQQWVDRTVERLLSLKPANVMEIGCGTGLFLFRLIPFCKTYVGTDIATRGLDYIRNQLQRLKDEKPETANWAEVKLLQHPADNFAGLEQGRPDLLILNSVIQYFPSADYLAQVLTTAADRAADGGRIFIGDVRLLPLLKTFHASVQFTYALDQDTREQVYARAMSTFSTDRELVVHPDFFAALKERVPRIKHVQMLLKYGSYKNELSMFRCDVILHIDSEDYRPVEPGREIDWKQAGLDISTLAQLLQQVESEEDILLVTGIPNGRITGDVRVLKWLSGKSEQEIETVGEYKKLLGQGGVDPEDILALREDLPFHIDLRLSSMSAESTFDALFVNKRAQAKGKFEKSIIAPAPGPAAKGVESWSNYTNNPLLAKMSAELVPQLRRLLRERLPEYMTPANFVLLDHFPLNANGKLDLRALPDPVFVLQDGEEEFAAPKTDLEEFFAGIWADVLNLEKSKISVNHNFFQLGGDSINAIQVVSRANKLGYQLNVQVLYRNQTIADLAMAVENLEPAENTALNAADMVVEVDREAVKKQLLPGLEIEDIYPATPLQLHQVNYLKNATVEDPPVFLFQRSGQPMNMDLDMDLLNKALQIVARKNTNLRTFLLWKGLEKPIQVVCKEVEFEFVSYDFSELDLDLEGKMAKYNRLLEDDWQETFDRSTNSPMRVAMIKLAEKLFIHFFAGDYMRVDGWSGNNVIDETFDVYGALAAGAPFPEKQANCYKEYMFTLVNQDRETAGKYWRSIFKDFTPQQQLTAIPGNKQGTGSGYARDHVYLTAEISAQLEKLLLEKRWSMSTLVQGIWALLLARYSGKDKVLYGMMTTGRSIAIAGIEYMNGHSINILPVIIEVKPGQSLDAYIQQVWDFQTEWTRFEYTEIEDIYDWLEITQKPLFDNFMVIQNLTSVKGEIRGMDRSDAVRHRASHQMYAKMEYPLRFDIFPGVEYCLILEYYRRLFTDAPIKGLLANLYDLLISVIQNPDQRVDDLRNSIDPERYKEFVDAEPNEFFK